MSGDHLNISYNRQMIPGDRLFAPINVLLIILSAIGHASSLMVNGKAHTDGKPNLLVCTRWPDLGFVLSLRGGLEQALVGMTPTVIEIGIITTPDDLTKPLPNTKLQTMGLNDTMAYVVSPIFLAFFERYNDWMTAKYGDVVNWPATLNFARVIRNAASHGKINFRNPGAAPVLWRGLTYGPADNGRQIIGTDIRLGEIIALMFDANDELDKLNAPIL